MKKGFTLVELLLVLAIIGLLLSIGMVQMKGVRIKAREATRVTHLDQLRKALEMYYVDYGAYPDTGGEWQGHCDVGENWIPGLAPAYMSELPENPTKCNCIGAIAGYTYKSDQANYKLIIDGCMETDFYSSAGDAFDDTVRTWEWAAIYSAGGKNW